MLLKLLRLKKVPVNWKYFFGEVVLIFTGITLAAWFNSKLEARKEYKEEKRIVAILLEDLHDDIQSVDFDVRILQNELTRLEKLEKWCGAGDKTLTFDSVKDGLYMLTREQWREINTTGYTLLMARGPELVKNEALRAKILHFYSQIATAAVKMEQSGNMMVQENIKYIADNFKSFDFVYGKQIVPKDTAALQADPKLKILVQDFMMRRSNNLAIYDDYLRTKMAELVTLIEKEYPTR